MKISNKEKVIQILENKYEGFKVIEWDNEDPAKMRISAEDGLYLEKKVVIMLEQLL